jgi:hypothetical protein
MFDAKFAGATNCGATGLSLRAPVLNCIVSLKMLDPISPMLATLQ